jgi:hypothetical protein
MSAPVEEKGYKSIINLPDLLNEPKKSQNPKMNTIKAEFISSFYPFFLPGHVHGFHNPKAKQDPVPPDHVSGNTIRR